MPQKIRYTSQDNEQVVCVPPQGFPRDRLVRYLELLRAQQAAPMEQCLQGLVPGFQPHEVRDFVELMCNDDLINGLDQPDREYLVHTARPGINAFLQREARKLRARRKLN